MSDLGIYTYPWKDCEYQCIIFCYHKNPHHMEEAHLSLAEKISQGVCLDSLPYVDKEVSIEKAR